jgi:hypothetical protein
MTSLVRFAYDIAKMMKNSAVIFHLVLLLIVSCKSKKEANTSDRQITDVRFQGNWISLTYQDSLDKYGTPAKVKNAGLEEIIINHSADSMCLNLEGVETPVFKIIDKKEKSFRVNKFNQDEFTEFILSDNGKELSYHYKKFDQNIIFFKAEPKYAVKIINGWATAAQLYFNERVLAANYFLLKSGSAQNAEVAFTSYGKIIGLQAYTDYSICYQGDCRSMSDEDLITLGDGNTSDNFIYEWKKDTLRFYTVTNVSRLDEKPQYIRSMEIFKFVKRI